MGVSLTAMRVSGSGERLRSAGVGEIAFTSTKNRVLVCASLA